MGLSRILRRRRRPLLVALAALAVFVLALVVWIGRQPESSIGPRHRADVSTTPSASPSPTPSGSSAVGSAGPAADPGQALPVGALPLPPLSTSLAGGAHGTHIVSMRATSDATILQLAYAVRGGSPPSVYRTYVKSPMSVTTVAHGDGIVAEIAAQASPTAKTVTCSVTVDGVTTTHTARGPYAVVVCIG